MTSIYTTAELPAPTMVRLNELFQVKGPGKGPLVKEAKGADVLISTLTDTVDAAAIDALLPELKLIANFGAGVDHIDVAHAKAKGVLVTNTPSVLTEDTADCAMALILAVPRRLSEAAQEVRKQEWQGWTPLHMLGHRVHGKTLGIVGMGRIGRAVAKRAAGFGLTICYYQRNQLHPDVEKEFGATYCPTLDGLLGTADIITLHCPHTAESHHMIGAPQFSMMKREAYLINTARGALVDEKALIHALKEGTIAGAGLDVYEHAPNIPEKLRAQPNVLLLPHVSSATIESRVEMGEKVIINIKMVADGHKPTDRVLA